MSLYTKYRPKDFDNLVDQDFIKKTLKTAILENKTV
jgi:DNA polymerase III gamma/tau subunit